MGGDSSKAKASPPAQKGGGVVDQKDKATLDLKNSRDRLLKMKKKWIDDESKMLARAKACYAKNDKKHAVMLMQLRQHKVKQIDNADAQLITVSNLVDTIQWETENMKVFHALKAGKEALEGIHKEMSVDMVLDLMDSLDEQRDINREISDAIGDSLGSSEYSDEELEAELYAMEKATGWKVTPSSILPVAPTGGLVVDAVETLPLAPVGELGDSPPAAPAKETRVAEAA
jgi:charged multivesicular body protein 6